MARTYSVNLWGSHPDAGNDDCWTGIDDIATYEEALAIAKDPTSGFTRPGSWAYVQILGPDEDDLTSDVQVELLVEPNPKAPKRRSDREDRDDMQDWRREQAMEAGMLHGIDAYNDAMGCGLDDDGGY
jgi:hypothetical protein